MAYLGRKPNTGVRSRYIYTATASQTTFSGSDDDGKTLKYEDAAYLDVFLNGVLLKPVTDYTATTKTSVVLTSGAAVSDIVEIVAYDIANIADTVSKANGGTFEADVTVQGTVTADGLTVDTSTLHVDSTNNRVGVLTASPGEPLDVSGNIRALGANSRVMFGPDGYEAGIKYATDASFQIASRTGETITFTNGTDGTERARIDCGSGNFFVGATAAFNNNVDSGVEIRPASLRIGSNQYVDNIMCCTAHTGTKYFLSFYQNGTFVGSITGNGSNTAFNTSSDYRLKENVVDLDGAIDRVKQIPVRQFNFIDKPDRTVDGFLAHEVQAVVPEAVTGTKDEVDDDGNPKYQGIDQSKLVPLLTAALQEAVAKIEALEARVSTLENA